MIDKAILLREIEFPDRKSQSSARERWCVMLRLLTGASFVLICAQPAAAVTLDDSQRQGIHDRPSIQFDAPSELQLSTQHPPRWVPVRPLFLPAAITRRDLERYGRILALSEAQANFLNIAYDEYEIENTALKEDRLRELWERAAEAAAHGGAILSDPQLAREQSSLYASREDYVQRMAAVERRFFDRLDAVLAKEQRLAMERVRMARERERYPVMAADLHGAKVDLTLIVDALQQRDDFVATNAAAFQAEMQQYERRLTTLRRGHWGAALERMTRGVELLVDHRIEADEKRRDELTQARETLIQRAGRTEVQLADLNERTVSRLEQHVSANTAETLRSHYLAAAYPRVFPDYYDARELIAIAMASEDLPTQVRAGVAAIASRYERAREQLHMEMTRLSREYGEFVALTQRSGGQTERSFMHDLSARHEKRSELADRAIRDIFELLPERESEAFAEVVTTYRKRIDELPRHVFQPEVVIQRR